MMELLICYLLYSMSCFDSVDLRITWRAVYYEIWVFIICCSVKGSFFLKTIGIMCIVQQATKTIGLVGLIKVY